MNMKKKTQMQISKQLRNSVIIGGIAMFASFSASATFSWANCYTGFIAFGFALFVELANQYGLKGKDGTFFFNK
jgi:hypothetical protein